MTATTEYPRVDWTKPIMLEGHGTLLRVEKRGYSYVCFDLPGTPWPNGKVNDYWHFDDDGTFAGDKDWRVVNVPETPELSQQAAEVCARLTNAVEGTSVDWNAHTFAEGRCSDSVAFRRTIELCLTHFDALPTELQQHIRPLSDEELLEREATGWADSHYKKDAFRWLAARDGFIAGASRKAAQS